MTMLLLQPAQDGGIPVPFLELSVHLPSILIWGLVGTLILTGLMYLGQELGFSRMGLPFLLGAIFTRDRKWAKILGTVVHFTSGMVFTFLYAILFQAMGRASWWIGGGMGLLHGGLLLTLGMELLPLLHPRVASERDGPTPTRWLQPPGFLAMYYGRSTPIIGMVAHLIFGMILGAGYRVV